MKNSLLRMGFQWALALAAAATLHAQHPAIDVSRVVDLTYNLEESGVFWPTAKPFEWKKDAWGMSPGGYWYTSASFASSEHGGTHLDSPIHFAEGKATVDQIPLSKLIAPAIVIDVATACAKDRDYQLTAGDISRIAIPAGSIVLIRTGWGKFWPNKLPYLGSDKPGDASNLHFPGISKAAAELLVKRNVIGVGIDTASIDYGPSKDFITHRILYGAGIYGLENIANLEKVPATGATLVALPMKIKGGTGGPARIIAILP